MAKKRKHKKNSYHNLFDNVFHTLATKMPRLIIPVINLLYDLNIPPDAPIAQLKNEFYEKNGKFITDSIYLIAGRRFHFECQSTADPTMSVRMFQYDTSIAIEHMEQSSNEFRITYPDSAVIYLRPRNDANNHKKRHTVTLTLPGNSAITYHTEIINVQDYTTKDILQKKLFLFLPFYIIRYEKLFKYNTFDTAWLNEFFHEYADIRDHLYNEFP